MPRHALPKVTDLIAYALAFGLAAACLSFAGYKIIKLRGMENPPADMGLNFPKPKRRMITDDSILVDPMVTNSLGSADAVNPAEGRILQPYTEDAPVEDYKLLTVIDGVAFVQVKTFKGKNIVPLTVGAKLPGAGSVERIIRIDGRWTLKAGEVTLAAERQ